MGAAGGAIGFCAGVLLATPPPANAGGFVVCVWIAGALFVIGLHPVPAVVPAHGYDTRYRDPPVEPAGYRRRA